MWQVRFTKHGACNHGGSINDEVLFKIDAFTLNRDDVLSNEQIGKIVVRVNNK